MAAAQRHKCGAGSGAKHCPGWDELATAGGREADEAARERRRVWSSKGNEHLAK